MKRRETPACRPLSAFEGMKRNSSQNRASSSYNTQVNTLDTMNIGRRDINERLGRVFPLGMLIRSDTIDNLTSPAMDVFSIDYVHWILPEDKERAVEALRRLPRLDTLIIQGTQPYDPPDFNFDLYESVLRWYWLTVMECLRKSRRCISRLEVEAIPMRLHAHLILRFMDEQPLTHLTITVEKANMLPPAGMAALKTVLERDMIVDLRIAYFEPESLDELLSNLQQGSNPSPSLRRLTLRSKYHCVTEDHPHGLPALQKLDMNLFNHVTELTLDSLHLRCDAKEELIARVRHFRNAKRMICFIDLRIGAARRCDCSRHERLAASHAAGGDVIMKLRDQFKVVQHHEHPHLRPRRADRMHTYIAFPWRYDTCSHVAGPGSRWLAPRINEWRASLGGVKDYIGERRRSGSGDPDSGDPEDLPGLSMDVARWTSWLKYQWTHDALAPWIMRGTTRAENIIEDNSENQPAKKRKKSSYNNLVPGIGHFNRV